MALKIFLATRNRGKLAEIRSIFSGIDVELVSPDDMAPYPEPPEDGGTFLENALIKARAAYEATGLPALADDSGIEVDALDGRPGVHSARYGGEGLSDGDRFRRLLEELADVPEERRAARFHCTMVLYPRPEGVGERGAGHGVLPADGPPAGEGGRDDGPAGGYLAMEGYLYGRIATSPAGSNGFGYDPVFMLPNRGLTVAQLAPEEKNGISHRYRALVEMKWLLVRECGVPVK